MIGLVVRQVSLKQFQVGVDGLRQPEPADQPVQRGDPAETGGVHVAADLVVHRAIAQDRDRLRAPVPGQPVSGLDSPAPSCRVPTTLIPRYLLHHKSLPAGLR